MESIELIVELLVDRVWHDSPASGGAFQVSGDPMANTARFSSVPEISRPYRQILVRTGNFSFVPPDFRSYQEFFAGNGQVVIRTGNFWLVTDKLSIVP
ncbi:MAG: hypothetical protein KDA55_13230, partial [Planctomycetales bacterium]|nr:hypothetical protein [Planctomycetales bacterium]